MADLENGASCGMLPTEVLRVSEDGFLSERSERTSTREWCR